MAGIILKIDALLLVVRLMPKPELNAFLEGARQIVLPQDVALNPAIKLPMSALRQTAAQPPPFVTSQILKPVSVLRMVLVPIPVTLEQIFTTMQPALVRLLHVRIII